MEKNQLLLRHLLSSEIATEPDVCESYKIVCEFGLRSPDPPRILDPLISPISSEIIYQYQEKNHFILQNALIFKTEF